MSEQQPSTEELLQHAQAALAEERALVDFLRQRTNQLGAAVMRLSHEVRELRDQQSGADADT